MAVIISVCFNFLYYNWCYPLKVVQECAGIAPQEYESTQAATTTQEITLCCCKFSGILTNNYLQIESIQAKHIITDRELATQIS